MNSKLILTLNHSIIEKARLYAESKGRSLPDIIENYLKVLVDNEKNESRFPTSLVNELRGSFKAPDDFDYKEELSQSLREKYMK